LFTRRTDAWLRCPIIAVSGTSIRASISDVISLA
jgi:hypothetical protein